MGTSDTRTRALTLSRKSPTPRRRAGGRIGLLDFGQSKQLPERERLAFAALIAELARGRRGAGAARPERVLQRLSDLGLRFERRDARLATRMAFGMFDTDGGLRRAATPKLDLNPAGPRRARPGRRLRAVVSSWALAALRRLAGLPWGSPGTPARRSAVSAPLGRGTFAVLTMLTGATVT